MRKIIQNTSLIGIMLLSNFNFCNATFKFSGNKATLGLSGTNAKLILNENISGFDGTLKLRTAASDNIKSINSETISFTDGSVQVGNSIVDLSGGTYDPQNAGTDSITLNNGNVFSVSSGTTIEHGIIVGASQTVDIIGTPNFSSAVTLNAGAILKLGIQHKLTQNIAMAANSIVELTDDLSLKDGIKFTGAGISGGSATIDLKKYSLEIGSSDSGSAWTGKTTFKRAQDIQLNGPAALTGSWCFITDSTDKESVLNGNGNILDLSTGGKITVGPDHTLYISDMHIKGFGANADAFDLTDTATAPGTVVLSNVTLELSANYLHNQGSIKVKGDNVRIIVGKVGGGAPYTFTVDENASLITTVKGLFEVDGQVLIYETLGGDNTNPFFKIVAGPTTSELVSADVASNGGIIRSAISDAISVDTEIDAVVNNGSTVTLTSNYDLFTNAASPGVAPTGRIVINNTSGLAKIITLDGSNYAWQFPGGTAAVLKIAADTTVTLANVVLKNFSLNNIEFGHATSSVLNFGDGVVMHLGADQTLPITNNGTRSLVFVGNATILGNGQTVTLTAGSSIVQQTAAKTLTIENLNIQTEHATGLACSSSTAIINLKDSRVVVNQAGYTLNTGSMDIEGTCAIASRVTNAAAGTANFSLATTGTLQIKSGAKLEVGRGINFQYQPLVTLNLLTDTPTEFSRLHLLFADPSSTLYLNGCTFTSTNTPVRFTKGNLIIDNKVQLNANFATAGLEAEIGTAMNVEILAGGNFNIDGNLKYIATTI